VTTLYVLGSGSSGNCLALEHEREVLLVDAGFSAREVERRAAQVHLDLRRVIGLALTHEHGDHATGAARLARSLGAPIIASAGTWAALRPDMPTARYVPLRLMNTITLGPFVIEACPTSHDAAEPVALSIATTDGLRIGIAYDLGRPTSGVRYLLRELHALVLEANHDEIRLRTSDYPASVQDRIAGSGGHLSNRAAAELIADVFHPGLGLVILAHLSARCNSPDEARDAVGPVLRERGFTGELHVAPQDRPLPPMRVRTLPLAETA
jgi:phosphoribosyl 1,2-cyclic phosphodiesterase